MKFSQDEINFFEEKRDWAITIEIPSFKYVPCKVKYGSMIGQSKYILLSKEEQEKILNKFKELANENNDSCDLIFENHKNGRRHCHGTIYKVTEERLKNYIAKFCATVGIRKEKQYSQIVYYKPVFNCFGWCSYCVKDIQQQEINNKIELLIKSVTEPSD